VRDERGMNDETTPAPHLRPDSVEDLEALVEGWRAKGAEASDPVGFCVAQAMARRAAGLDPATRAWVARRMVQRLAQGPTQPDAGPSTEAIAARVPPPTSVAGLSELIERLGRAHGPRPDGGSPHPGFAGGESPQPLNAVTQFKDTWTRLRADQRLRQSRAQLPSMAGPLNSAQVVHRALEAMHEVSPTYLDAFMRHVDTLSWLEQTAATDRPPRTHQMRMRDSAGLYMASPGRVPKAS
jgi:hypothetical protein